MLKTAVIMSGGKGTRLKSLSTAIPKCMVEIGGDSILSHQLSWLEANAFENIYIVAHHLSGLLIDHVQLLKLQNRFTCSIEVIVELEPKGTGGALSQVEKLIRGDFLFVLGDILFNFSLAGFYEFHVRKKSILTVLIHPNSHPQDSDLVLVDSEKRITSVLCKPHEDTPYSNLAVSGISIANEKIFEVLTGEFLDFYQEVLIRLVDEKNEVYGYQTTEYVADCGTPDRLSKVRQHFEDGVVQARHLGNKQKALFVDRDGTLNELDGYITSVEQIQPVQGAIELVKVANQLGFIVIVITNQPVIARGDISEDELVKIHYKLAIDFALETAVIDAFFYCPHHPDSGFEGEIYELKIPCDCRKPRAGLLEQAIEYYNIDRDRSFMVGDSECDVEAGIMAGVDSILIEPQSTVKKPREHSYSVVSNISDVKEMLL